MRFGHGTTMPLETFVVAANATGAAPRTFDFMSGALATNPANRVEDDAAPRLIELAKVMTDNENETPSRDSRIPAAYTYFGQFLDHDITLEATSGDLQKLGAEVTPLQDPGAHIANGRTAALDLDSVYAAAAPRNGARFVLGEVSGLPGNPRPPHATDDLHDLPRLPPSNDERIDRAARIGDPRNDENLVVGQMHVAFLRAHNELVRRGHDFPTARRMLRQLFQSIVLEDFLVRIGDPDIVKDVLDNGPRAWTPAAAPTPFMPLEFAGAVYRFGHSMVRAKYDYNRNFPAATLRQLFAFTALSGDINAGVLKFDQVPENWIIEWDRFLDGGTNRARRIDTVLSFALDELRDATGRPMDGDIARRLAVRNLLRGFRLGLPTGQAMATWMHEAPATGNAFLAWLPTAQRKRVDQLGFSHRTPLWFYVLAEAGDPNGPAGAHLGRVGSRIVAETLYNLVAGSADSIIAAHPGRTWPRHTLAELFDLAGVLPAPAPVI